MFAVIQVGSNQYRIQEGDTIEANRLGEEKGKTLMIDKVLFFENGEDVRVGQPYLKDVKVTATVLGDTLDEKKIAFKFRRRKGYAKKKGHRQKLTALTITKIAAS
ncbi:MAG: 50S ribosomal protein L21 [Candidatus Omnitrophota bacterium]|nr:50S ribosomal protein L21 [Candidatus Omnitrophota bacterium]MDZ4242553.1 50S ribosomal protein L21 [Candidatus Omnitrophota bacterium]